MTENTAGMLLFAVLALPFVGSLIAGLLRANAPNAEAWLAGSVSLVGLVLVSTNYPRVADGGVVKARLEWVPELGLDFTLRMDGLAWVFAMLVTGIGLLVVVYAGYYMSPADPVPRFYSFLLAFMGAMLGIVLSGNLIQLVFFWELTGLFVPADRLLASDRPGPRGSANGPDHHVGRRALSFGGRAGAWTHRRQLRPQPCARLGRGLLICRPCA
jgi:NADH:ubiquinone oxidoreductase subunit 4 (subunit M)